MELHTVQTYSLKNYGKNGNIIATGLFLYQRGFPPFMRLQGPTVRRQRIKVPQEMQEYPGSVVSHPDDSAAHGTDKSLMKGFQDHWSFFQAGKPTEDVLPTLRWIG